MSSISPYSGMRDWWELPIGFGILIGLQLLVVLIVSFGNRMERQAAARKKFTEMEKRAEEVRERDAIVERVDSLILLNSQTAQRRDAGRKVNLL